MNEQEPRTCSGCGHKIRGRYAMLTWKEAPTDGEHYDVWTPSPPGGWFCDLLCLFQYSLKTLHFSPTQAGDAIAYLRGLKFHPSYSPDGNQRHKDDS